MTVVGCGFLQVLHVLYIICKAGTCESVSVMWICVLYMCARVYNCYVRGSCSHHGKYG